MYNSSNRYEVVTKLSPFVLEVHLQQVLHAHLCHVVHYILIVQQGGGGRRRRLALPLGDDDPVSSGLVISSTGGCAAQPLSTVLAWR